MSGNPRKVAWSPISLVFFPLPPRVAFCQFDHQRVPVDLGNIRGCRNAKIAFVRLDREQDRFEARTQAHRIDDDRVTSTVQCQNGRTHRSPSGLENIDPVNHFRPDFNDHPGITVLPNPLRSQIPPTLGNLLGVANTVMVWNLRKPSPAYNNGARQGPASNFVNSNDRRRVVQ